MPTSVTIPPALPRFEGVDLDRRSWPFPFLRAAAPFASDDTRWPAPAPAPDAAPPELGAEATSECAWTAWLEARVDQLGPWLVDPPTEEGEPPRAQDAVDQGHRVLLGTLSVAVRLVHEVLEAAGPSPAGDGPSPPRGLLLAEILAHAAGLRDAGRSLGELADAQAAGVLTEQDVARGLRAPLSALGAAWKTHALVADHPLHGRSFHAAIARSDLRLVGQLALARARAPLERGAVGRALSLSRRGRERLIAANLALVWADGKATRLERRFLEALQDVARLSPGARQRLDIEAPPTPEAFAAEVVSPSERRHLLKQIVFAALVDGDLDASEQRCIAAFAEAFEIGDDELLILHAEVGAFLAENPRLASRFGWRAGLGRLGRAAEHRVEALLRRHGDAIRRELGETGDLVQLLGASTRRELSADEQARLRRQLADLARAVPALALFAAPGGSVLLPVLAKVLPFSILPSAFEDSETGVL